MYCITDDVTKTAFAAFRKFVVPTMRSVSHAKNICSTERRENPLAELLSRAGIDLLIVDANGRTLTFGTAIEFVTTDKICSEFHFNPYDYEKLRQSWQIRPELYVQCYVAADEQSATIAVTATDSLRREILKNHQWRFLPMTADNYLPKHYFFIPFEAIPKMRLYRVDKNGALTELPF